MTTSRREITLGVAIGVAVAAAVLAWMPGGPPPRPSGVVLSECDGAIRELVIQYEPGGLTDIAPVYREFLRQLGPAVTVWAVCPDQAAFDQLRGVVGPTACRLSPVVAGHPITAWARDRWAALAYAGGATRLVYPAREAGAAAWPARAGDERVAEDLAAAIPGVQARRSELYFDGGDILATARHAILMPRIVSRNLGRTVESPGELAARMKELLGRPSLLLDEAPDHHAAMFMVPAGQDLMLVGDPSLAKKALDGRPCPPAVADLPDGPDLSPNTQRLLDSVARQCERAGYRVVRIPVVPGGDSRTFLTWCNVIIDRHGGTAVVYMPTFAGAGPLNDEAAGVWRSLGYEVRPIDCTSVYRHFGCLHCLVNVLRRG